LDNSEKKDHYNPGSWSGKPYNFFGDYLISKYRCKILKLPISIGSSCPNRDGSINSGGCIFCSDDGSAAPTADEKLSITEQMKKAMDNFRRSDIKTRYMAYFQAYTNTYGDRVLLKKAYDEAVEFHDIMGLMIGTRPDCIDNKIADIISRYRKENFELWVELGLQTVHNESLSFLNRGHSYEDTLNAVNILNSHGIDICLHVILGIPGESWDDMIDTAEKISALPVQGVKIHHLHIIKGTPLEKIYKEENFKILTMKQYVSIICDFMEHLRPDITIHRLMGDRMEDSLIEPKWGLHKGTVIKAIEDEFHRRGTFQGFLSI